ncbi:MAG: hypothetical protein V2I27_09410 [Erythrobacter sp.]|jgi:hypothetical protein|nr:hypothetical protein [Erythrobacter sp.]
MRYGLIGGLALLSACSETPPCERDIEAFVMSQRFIEQQLRSPSTADFPSVTEASIVAVPKGEICAFRVTTHVDAQNAFGGTVREYFVVELEPSSTDRDTWNLISIDTM